MFAMSGFARGLFKAICRSFNARQVWLTLAALLRNLKRLQRLRAFSVLEPSAYEPSAYEPSASETFQLLENTWSRPCFTYLNVRACL
jgi:hypothetical protein